ncbi:putative membrane protein, partial [Rhodopirellula maiorica SM1]
MKALIITWTSRVRDSYWFVPSVLAVTALMLSFVTTELDNHFGSEWLEEIGWLYANEPAGARAVLSTVAGSMITVAGVTFSMTILSISYTTSQVGARLLNNFMRDRGNQITLGVFISTFLYCLMVLRTVRNAESAPVGDMAKQELASAFVPHIAVIVGIMLAILSVAVLIYFIHHIPESIHVSNILAGIGGDLNRQIERQFPARVGKPHEDLSQRQVDSNLPPSFYETAKTIRSRGSGYVEFVDMDGVMGIAVEHDLTIRMRFRAGDFVTPGNVLMLASPASRVSDEIVDQLRATYVSGAQRTAKQNLRFVFNQLVEVAERALSPGVNDPFTAISCMDWLQSALQHLAEREMPDAYRYDSNDKLRIVAEPETFSDFVSLVSDQLRPYVAADRNASIHM